MKETSSGIPAGASESCYNLETPDYKDITIPNLTYRLLLLHATPNPASSHLLLRLIVMRICGCVRRICWHCLLSGGRAKKPLDPNPELSRQNLRIMTSSSLWFVKALLPYVGRELQALSPYKPPCFQCLCMRVLARGEHKLDALDAHLSPL